MALSAKELKQMIDEYEDSSRTTEQGAANLQTALSSYIKSRESVGMNRAFDQSQQTSRTLNKNRIIR